jgi:hypothetical protein
LFELGWGERLPEERFEEGGDAGGVHGEPGEILVGVMAETKKKGRLFLVGCGWCPLLVFGETRLQVLYT